MYPRMTSSAVRLKSLLSKASSRHCPTAWPQHLDLQALLSLGMMQQKVLPATLVGERLGSRGQPLTNLAVLRCIGCQGLGHHRLLVDRANYRHVRRQVLEQFLADVSGVANHDQLPPR